MPSTPRVLVTSFVSAAALAAAGGSQLSSTPKLQSTPTLPLRQILTCVPKTSTLYVRAGVAGGVGTVERPLASIAQALEVAAKENACELIVEVGTGIYPELLTVTRNSTIRGRGRDSTVLRGGIENRSGRRLTLERLSLRATVGPAIVVAHATSRTELREVTIDAASRYGVRQSGGTLLLSNAIVTSTSGGASPYDGTAIYVDGGADVLLERVTLSGNAQGLVAEGGATKVKASRLEVRDGRTNTAYRGDPVQGRGLGAVEVRAARLLVEDSTLADNTGIALLVAERAHLHARRVVATGSRSIPTQDPFSSWGGINVVVNSSEVELVEFESGQAPIAFVDTQSEVRAEGLFIHDAELGLAVTSSDEPNRVQECLGRIRQERVGNYGTFQRPSGSLPLPPSLSDPSFTCLLNPERPECQTRRGTFRPCVRVPWE